MQWYNIIPFQSKQITLWTWCFLGSAWISMDTLGAPWRGHHSQWRFQGHRRSETQQFPYQFCGLLILMVSFDWWFLLHLESLQSRYFCFRCWTHHCITMFNTAQARSLHLSEYETGILSRMWVSCFDKIINWRANICCGTRSSVQAASKIDVSLDPLRPAGFAAFWCILPTLVCSFHIVVSVGQQGHFLVDLADCQLTRCQGGCNGGCSSDEWWLGGSSVLKLHVFRR